MSKGTCEPARKEEPKRTLHLNETCNTCYFWDKEYWYTKSYLGQPEVPIENVHPCNRMPQPVKNKCSTDWCGEWKLEAQIIERKIGVYAHSSEYFKEEEPKQITDQREDYNGPIYRRQDRERVPAVLRVRIHSQRKIRKGPVPSL